MLLALRPEKLERLRSGIHMDTRVLLFVLVVSVATGNRVSEWRRYGSRLARTLPERLKESGRGHDHEHDGASHTEDFWSHRKLAIALVLLVGARFC